MVKHFDLKMLETREQGKLFRVEEAQGATRLGATRLRVSERKSASERVSERTSETSKNLWKPLNKLWKPLKTSENPLKTSQNLSRISENPPSQRPSQRQISSQRLSVPLPLFCCPLNSLRLGLALSILRVIFPCLSTWVWKFLEHRKMLKYSFREFARKSSQDF